MAEIQFDDIAALSAEASEEFGPFGPELEVTQEIIQRFADLTGDHQWIHVDVERAKRESPFGGTIAHGFLLVSLIPKLRGAGAAAFTVVGYANATNYGSDGFRFVSPVAAGARIHGRSRLVGAEAKPKGTLVTTETAVHVVGNEKPALLYKGLVMYQGKKAG